MKKFLVALGLALTVLNPTLVMAADPPTPAPTTKSSDLPIYQGVDGSIQDYLCTPSVPADGHDLERCINRLFKFGVSAGALVLVFFVVVAGYLYITGGETGKTKGKHMILNSLTGMAILLGGYVLLYFINPTLVQFRPIQPPIFSASDLPTCEDVGFGEKCVTSTGEETTGSSTGGSQGPSAKNCPGGLVAIGSEIPTSGSASASSQICKDLKDKLLIVVNASKTSTNPWAKKWGIRSQPFGPGHKSNCHSGGNPQTGTCVDVGFGPVEGSPGYVKGNPQPLVSPRADRYHWLCSEIAKANIIIHNEAVATGSSCGTWNAHDWATNWHLHLILPG